MSAPITLCGFPMSNYYNKVKVVLLEKGIAFVEENVKTGSKDPAILAATPLGKVPFIRTPHGTLCESQVIVEYLDAAFPAVPLMPTDPFAAAKVRELTTFIELHLELTARQLYASAFFGAPALSEGNLARIRKQLETHIAGFKSLAQFAPYVAGNTFTQADCAAFGTLPALVMASKASFGEDLLIAGGVDHKAYMALLGERASVQRVVADRKAAATPQATQ